MKLQNTLKAAIAAAMLGSAMHAGAAINNGDVNQPVRAGELFLSVWDTTAKVSYVRDLGITFANWMTSQSTIGKTYVADSLYTDILNGTNLSGRNDSTRLDASVVGTPLAAFSTNSNLLWNVVTVSNPSVELLATSKAPVATMLTNTGLDIGNATQASASYVNQNNILQPGGPYNYAVNTSNVAVAADGSAYSGNTLTASDRFGGAMNWSNAALSTPTVQNQMKFYLVQQDPSTDPNLPVVVSEVANGAYWSFNGATGALVYAVPEAETWALFGAGLVMLGGIARRKRSA